MNSVWKKNVCIPVCPIAHSAPNWNEQNKLPSYMGIEIERESIYYDDYYEFMMVSY